MNSINRDYENLIHLLFSSIPNIASSDMSHDGPHIRRVLNMAITIAQKEGADLEIIIPAALYHDAAIYRKNDPRNKFASEESAKFAERMLKCIDSYPKHKIPKVMDCINECSFSKGLEPSSLESKILQDADRLEATGAISIMRTFSSGGQMCRPFYYPNDPFRKNSTPEDSNFSLDLLYKRLFVVSSMMHTETAKLIAYRRNVFLKIFEDELELELEETGEWIASSLVDK